MRCRRCAHPLSACRRCGGQHTKPFCSTGHFGRRALLRRVQAGSVASAGTHVSGFARHSLQYRPGVFWVSLLIHWISHCQIRLPSSIFRSTPRDRGFVLSDQQFRELPFTLIRGPSVPLHFVARSFGSIAGPVARRDRRERETLARTGQRSAGTPVSAAVDNGYGPPDVVQVAHVSPTSFRRFESLQYLRPPFVY